MSATICIVDDDPAILKTLSGFLEPKGVQVTLAKTGVEALNVIQADLPDVVLLDLWLPELDGLEVLKRVREQFPNIVVIMMCGHGSVETAVKATRLGAYDYMEKPLYLEKVRILVRNAVRERRFRNLIMKVRQNAQYMRFMVIFPSCDKVMFRWDKIAEFERERIIDFFLSPLERFVRKALDQSSDGSEWGDNIISFRKDPNRLKRFSFGKKSWEGKYGVGIAPDKDNARKVIIGVWRECDAEKNTRAPKVQPEGHLKNKLDETIGPGKDNDWWEWYHPLQNPYQEDWGTPDRPSLYRIHKEEAENIGGQLVAIINVAAPIIDEHVRRIS